MIEYLEPLRSPPKKSSPPNFLQCDFSSHGTWKQLSTDPPIYTCDDFLSDAECEELINAEGQSLRPSLTAGDEMVLQIQRSGKPLPPGTAIRSSSSATMHAKWPAMVPLTRKIERLTRKDSTHFEPAAVTRYLKGEQ